MGGCRGSMFVMTLKTNDNEWCCTCVCRATIRLSLPVWWCKITLGTSSKKACNWCTHGLCWHFVCWRSFYSGYPLRLAKEQKHTFWHTSKMVYASRSQFLSRNVNLISMTILIHLQGKMWVHLALLIINTQVMQIPTSMQTISNFFCRS